MQWVQAITMVGDRRGMNTLTGQEATYSLTSTLSTPSGGDDDVRDYQSSQMRFHHDKDHLSFAAIRSYSQPWPLKTVERTCLYEAVSHEAGAVSPSLHQL